MLPVLNPNRIVRAAEFLCLMNRDVRANRSASRNGLFANGFRGLGHEVHGAEIPLCTSIGGEVRRTSRTVCQGTSVPEGRSPDAGNLPAARPFIPGDPANWFSTLGRWRAATDMLESACPAPQG